MAGHKFIPEMRLRQLGFTYSAYELFNKNKERTQKFKETGDSRDILQNGLDKSCFYVDKTYRDFKDLPRRTVSDKVLRYKTFNIAKSPKYGGYQRGLALMVYKFFDKRTSGGAAKNKMMENKELAK